MNCVRCGAPLASDERFCGYCGAPVVAPAPAPAYPPAAAPASVHTPAPWPQPAEQGPSYAGFWRRFAAALIDGIVLGPVWFVASGLYELLGATILERTVFAPDGAGLSRAMGLLAAGRWLVLALLILAYFALPEATRRGASLGKLILRLRVAKPDGSRAGLLRSIARTAFKPLSALPLMIGFLMAAWSGRKQALHDLLSGCVVLRV